MSKTALRIMAGVTTVPTGLSVIGSAGRTRRAAATSHLPRPALQAASVNAATNTGTGKRKPFTLSFTWTSLSLTEE